MPKAKNAESEIAIDICVVVFEMYQICSNAGYFLHFTIACSLFFCLVDRKYHFRSRRPIANVVFSASLDKKKSYTNDGRK